MVYQTDLGSVVCGFESHLGHMNLEEIKICKACSGSGLSVDAAGNIVPCPVCKGDIFRKYSNKDLDLWKKGNIFIA